jgi:hypothetical protein
MSAARIDTESGWYPLSQLGKWTADSPHVKEKILAVEVLDLAGDVWLVPIAHTEPRAHGATLSVELPPLAALWRYA